MAAFSNHSVTVRVNTKELVKKLRENREKHEQIVKEARTGYVNKAKMLIATRLEQLNAGKIVSLTFALHMPVSMLSSYDDAIAAFEMHTEETIELTVDDVSNYMRDKWTWKQNFLTSNAIYSKMAGDEVGDASDHES